jgi:hypothetical protein
MAILEALTSVVSERAKKRRRSTLQFVRDDVKKKLRTSHADVPSSYFKDLLDSLLVAGELIHRDGSAIRSATAPFVLAKDAAELNEALVRLSLRHLMDAGVDVSDTGRLAELFYGDPDRNRQVEENLAYLASAPDDSDLDNLDALLVPAENGEGHAPEDSAGGEDEEAVTVSETSEDAPAKPRRRARRRRKTSDTDDGAGELDIPDLDALLRTDEGGEGKG